MPKSQRFVAVESAPDVRQAIDIWEKKFSQDAQRIAPMGGATFWHENLGIWGHFSTRTARGQRAEKFWNPFGREPHRLRQNMVVEINPGLGVKPNVVGLIALDAKGDRWVMHRGRLHPSEIRITEDMFDKATGLKRFGVRFSDNSTVGYHPVANIDAPAAVLQKQVASYVFGCGRVRLYYVAGADAAEQDANVEAAEGESSPERQGSYAVGPQPGHTVDLRHADVWHALTKALDAAGVKHSNARVGRQGPDLRTLGTLPVLFEIKSDCAARDVQQAVGQLLLYEQYLGADHRKVLVLPDALDKRKALAVTKIGLRTLRYARTGRGVKFSAAELMRVLR